MIIDWFSSVLIAAAMHWCLFYSAHVCAIALRCTSVAAAVWQRKKLSTERVLFHGAASSIGRFVFCAFMMYSQLMHNMYSSACSERLATPNPSECDKTWRSERETTTGTADRAQKSRATHAWRVLAAPEMYVCVRSRQCAPKKMNMYESQWEWPIEMQPNGRIKLDAKCGCQPLVMIIEIDN